MSTHKHDSHSYEYLDSRIRQEHARLEADRV